MRRNVSQPTSASQRAPGAVLDARLVDQLDTAEAGALGERDEIALVEVDEGRVVCEPLLSALHLLGQIGHGADVEAAEPARRARASRSY